MTQGKFVSWERPQLAYVLYMQVREAAIVVMTAVFVVVVVMVLVSVSPTKMIVTRIPQQNVTFVQAVDVHLFRYVQRQLRSAGDSVFHPAITLVMMFALL